MLSSIARYSMVITGQGITAFSALIVINLVNKVSQNWFSPKERTLATTILSLNPTAAMMIRRHVEIRAHVEIPVK